jgi:hypothetical protein
MTRDLTALSLEQLKAEADAIGLAYHPNIGAVKLAEKLGAVENEAPGEEAEVEGDVQIADEPAPAAIQPHTAMQSLNATPAKVMCTPANVREALVNHIARGLEIVTLTPEYWHIRRGLREDSGNMNMPITTLKQCANLLMGPTSAPTEDMSFDEILAVKQAQIR